jgi:hypothetical protein
MGFIRKVVKHRDEKGRKVRVIVKHSEEEVLTRDFRGVPVVIFTTQKDSGIEIVQKSLVDEIVLEEEDPKYGTFRKIGNVDF